MREHWDALELRHLATLRAIASEGSFSGAARAIGHVPSVVSQQLAELERITGVRLVDRGRGRRSVTLTPAGVVLLRHAEALDARLGAARADLRAIATGSAAALGVGTFQSVSARVLPSLLTRYMDAWPGVALAIHDSVDDRDLLPLIESGDLDVAFSILPLDEGPFQVVEVLRDPWLLLTPPGSPLATRPVPIPLQDLAEEPLIAFAAASGTQASLEDAFRSRGLVPRIALRANESAAIHGLVAAGFASSLMPALAVDMADGRIARVPVDVPPRLLGLAWHADRVQSPAAAAFISLARLVCADIVPTLG